MAVLLSACAGKKPYVEYENSAMANTIKVSEIRTRNQFDLQQFSVDLSNKTSKEVRFQYKFKFFDKDGFEVMADSRPWTRKILSAKETVAIQVAAPDASVLGGKIYIKE
jgi:uncharacterized protein YcfL